MSRYARKIVAINEQEIYKETLKKRGVERIEQYKTITLKDYEDFKIESIEHIWTCGDSFWNLAAQHYGNSKYWYIIARYNNTPTEAHVSIGQIIKIPIKLALALQAVV